MEIVRTNMDTLYRDTLNQIMLKGLDASPRGKKTNELLGVSLKLLSPQCNLLLSPARKLNYHFMVGEFLWMLLGRNDVATIGRFNKQISAFSDDGVSFSGAYGPKLIEQLPYVIKTLIADPFSRQAVLTIWRERPGSTKDVPCTVAMQFLLRDKKLDMVTYMRSNDAWLGLPYDIYNFTMLQNYVAAALKVGLGTYHHVVGSLHVYEEHFEKAQAVADENILVESPCESARLTYPVHEEVTMAFGDASSSTFAKAPATEQTHRRMVSTVRGYIPPEWGDLIEVLMTRTTEQVQLLPEPFKTLFDANEGRL